MHGEWIREMVFGEGDYTLQAHRGSYKSSCLAVAVSLMLVLYAKQNIIFLRKTDSDVSEMLGMVSKILKSEIVKDIAKAIYKTELSIISESTRFFEQPRVMKSTVSFFKTIAGHLNRESTNSRLLNS